MAPARKIAMTMNRTEVTELLNRYKHGECTKEETLLVEAWYIELVKQQSTNTNLESAEDLAAKKEKIWAALYESRISSVVPIKSRIPIKRKLAIAASISIIAAAGLAYFLHKDNKVKLSQNNIVQQFGPGTNKATLTLADGTVIALDEKNKGNIKDSQGITIKKTDEGKVIYSVNKHTGSTGSTSLQNIITTPKGGQFEIILEDGSHVYLNAASSLTYPEQFSDSIREVKLSGEAYFEIAKNPRKPFIVSGLDQKIKVTGTHFNVSSYVNEPLLTTLAEGAVMVSNLKTGKTISLKPGQQSFVTDRETLINEVNPEDVLAWKDGWFVFNQTPLRLALLQIGRWYNVDVDLTSIPDKTFDGQISRKLSLMQVLSLLEKSSNIKFTMAGRRIMGID